MTTSFVIKQQESSAHLAMKLSLILNLWDWETV